MTIIKVVLYIHDTFSRRQNYLFAHASGIFFTTYLIKCDIIKKRIKNKKKSQIWKGVVVGIESYNKPVTKQSENDIFFLYRKVALSVYSVLYKKKASRPDLQIGMLRRSTQFTSLRRIMVDARPENISISNRKGI